MVVGRDDRLPSGRVPTTSHPTPRPGECGLVEERSVAVQRHRATSTPTPYPASSASAAPAGVREGNGFCVLAQDAAGPV